MLKCLIQIEGFLLLLLLLLLLWMLSSYMMGCKDATSSFWKWISRCVSTSYGKDSCIDCFGTMGETQSNITSRAHLHTVHSIALICESILLAAPHCFHCCSRAAPIAIGMCESPTVEFLWQDCFRYPTSLSFIAAFIVIGKLGSDGQFLQKATLDFDRGCIQSADHVLQCCHFHHILFSDPSTLDAFVFKVLFYTFFQCCFGVFRVSVLHIFCSVHSFFLKCNY